LYGLDAGAIARDRQKVTVDAKFDWGLQLIITGLKPTLKETKETPSG
jgi:hypothetical protein